MLDVVGYHSKMYIRNTVILIKTGTFLVCE